MASQCFADAYSISFGKEDELLEFIKERDENSEWKKVSTKGLELKAMSDYQEYDSIRRPVWVDTLNNTKLLLRTEGKEYPVRDCAIKTILQRAKISGSALSRLEKNVFADILNSCLDIAEGESLIKIADEKVSAIHSGDEGRYAVLEISELFKMIKEYFSKNFKGYKFESATFEHPLVSAVWSFPNSKALIETYKNALLSRGKVVGEIIPMVRFATSDAGVCGANLYPMLLDERKHGIALGSTLKLLHKKGASLDDFNKKLDYLFPKYLGAIADLRNLLDVGIEYPLQTMLRVMKEVDISKKLAYSALDLYKNQMGEDPCTAHDIYLGINEVTFFLECDGASSDKIIQTEENISRALKIKWKEFDHPGPLEW